MAYNSWEILQCAFPSGERVQFHSYKTLSFTKKVLFEFLWEGIVKVISTSSSKLKNRKSSTYIATHKGGLQGMMVPWTMQETCFVGLTPISEGWSILENNLYQWHGALEGWTNDFYKSPICSDTWEGITNWRFQNCQLIFWDSGMNEGKFTVALWVFINCELWSQKTNHKGEMGEEQSDLVHGLGSKLSRKISWLLAWVSSLLIISRVLLDKRLPYSSL